MFLVARNRYRNTCIYIYIYIYFFFFPLDKKAMAKRGSLVNFDKLNHILRSEIFLHRDG